MKSRRVLLGKGPEIYAKAKKKMAPTHPPTHPLQTLGFKVKSRRVLLGKGPEIYAKAKKKMANWDLNSRVKWVNFLEGEHGINVVSRIKCFGLFWTLNPLRKVLCHEKPWGKHGSVAAVAVSTLQGHLLEGEERFSVCFEGGRQGDVWFDMLSFSKGRHLTHPPTHSCTQPPNSSTHTPIHPPTYPPTLSTGAFPFGRLLMPLIRPLQVRFFVDLGKAMQTAVQEEIEAERAAKGGKKK